MRKVDVVAHRGASGSFPENTASAFREAIRLGVEMIEFDVHLTADQQLVIIHDGSVDRTSNATGRVAEMRLADIKALDAGSWFGERFAGERLLTLAEALELMPPQMRLNVHVKAYPEDRERLVPLALEQLVRREWLSRAFIASDEASLVLARKLEKDLEICNLSTRPVETYVARSAAMGCRILQPGHAMTTAELVAQAHAQGMTVNPFYADDEEEMRRLIACGVDGMLTNYPERLQELLGR